jgi:hypothetical protein
MCVYLTQKIFIMKKQTVRLFGRELPLTKTGSINRTHLTKDEKKVYDEFVEKAKKEKKAIIIEELEGFFSKK